MTAGLTGTAGLRRVMERWQQRFSTGTREATEWPVLDILYSFLPWMPSFQDDPEHQVYLEAVSRAAAQAATFSPYRSLVLINEPHRTRSIESTIRDIIAPIADDLVEADEDIMASVPRDRLNIMTIHQAKGLEYPLVIVDVASDFKTNHPKQRFRRFPDAPSSVTELEDDLARCTPIGPLRTARAAIQRSFEDLIRLYYVAYSRPQSVLLLVGCLPSLRYDTTIKNIATYWARDGEWNWRRPARGKVDCEQHPSRVDLSRTWNSRSNLPTGSCLSTVSPAICFPITMRHAVPLLQRQCIAAVAPCADVVR
jgi:DNA helicase II / ATP-dependent DNA helicase PcrA